MSKKEFQTLNGLRGIAALLVVVYHEFKFFRVHPEHGYLAVDLFFVISGFILSHVYGSALDAGMSLWDFMRARICRLAPLYWLGLLLSLVVCLIDPESFLHHLPVGISGGYLFFGFFLIPSHFAGDTRSLAFIFNFPSWSLFLEVVINVIHAVFLRRISTRKLLAVSLAAMVLLLAYGLFVGESTMDFGWRWPRIFTGGIFRVIMSYTTGMLVYRLWQSGKLKTRLPAGLVVLLAATVFWYPARTHHLVFAGCLTVAIMAIVFPALVLMGANREPSQGFGRVFHFLGMTSYAVYALHLPVFHLWDVMSHRAQGWMRFESPVWGVVLLAGLVMMAYLLEPVFDVPARRWLRSALEPRQTRKRSSLGVLH